MNDLSTLPLSVRQHLERNQDQSLGQTSAQQALESVFQSLANQSPELCSLLLAAQLGYRGFTISHSETETKTVRIEKRALGIRYSDSTTETAWERESSRSLHLD